MIFCTYLVFVLTVVCRLLYVRFSTFPISFVITALFYIPHSSRLLRLLVPLLNYFRRNTYTWLCVCNLCLVQDSSKPDLWNNLSQDKCFKCMLWTKCFTMHCYFALGSTVKYCDDVSVCLSVCLSARKNIFRTTRPIFTNLCACYLWPWLGPPSDGVAIRYVLPVSCMTSYLHTVRHMHGVPV